MINAYILASVTDQQVDFSSVINITAFLVFFGIALAVTASLAFWACIFIVQFLKDRKNGKNKLKSHKNRILRVAGKNQKHSLLR